MIEEHRDPELESVRHEWEAPPPGEGFHARVLAAFDAEMGRSRWWGRWSVAVAVAAAGVLIAVVISRPTETAGFQPVRKPHFIIVSAGEHP